MTLLGEVREKGPKNEGTKGQLKGRTPSGGSKKVLPKKSAPTQEELFGPGGKKVASDAQALAKMKTDAPDLHEQVRSGQMSVPQTTPVPLCRRPAVGRSSGVPRPQTHSRPAPRNRAARAVFHRTSLGRETCSAPRSPGE
jgi:hypothetical protein